VDIKADFGELLNDFPENVNDCGA